MLTGRGYRKMIVVNRPGLRSRDPTSLHVFEKPARPVSGIETVRAVVRTDREAVCGSGTGAGETSVGGWQLRRGECRQTEPHSTRADGGSRTSQPFGASESGGAGT